MDSDITSATKAMMESAIAFCTEKAGLKDREQFLETRRKGDCSVCEYLRYGLAREVAAYLGSVDNRAKAIYVYDELESPPTRGEHPTDRPNLLPGIRLVVWVSAKSPALSALVDSLALAVDEELCRLPCPKANALCRQLDVATVDDHEVQERIGYGALITSFYLRPIEIWRR